MIKAKKQNGVSKKSTNRPIQNSKANDPNLVRYSRAGDEFHYRWAARRCLNMIRPGSPVTEIIIEGSKESKAKGEYVIDVSEYSKTEDAGNSVIYFQLKHTTKRTKKKTTFSELKNTLVEFGKRFHELSTGNRNTNSAQAFRFEIITNRPISTSIKNLVEAIRKGGVVDAKDHSTLSKYTGLNGNPLKEFCKCLDLVDTEGDFNEQRFKLRKEMSRILADPADDTQLDHFVSLVRERVLPDNKSPIVREDIYKRLGATREIDLFPAPPEFEKLENAIKRNQHEFLLTKIVAAANPIIIHAPGGVGKSVACRQLSEDLPDGSIGIVYDCFGGGKYRRIGEPRHLYRVALVQVINEIAVKGLCDPLIPKSTDPDDSIVRAFRIRIENAVKILRSRNNDAVLAVFFDAADNSEMAARENGHTCFASGLLREEVPKGCRIIALARSERVVEYLRPQSNVLQYSLEPFDREETNAYLKRFHPTATKHDSLEFFRLTGGNPRVQANALQTSGSSLEQVLSSLGPGMNVDDQIEAQLNAAILRLKDANFLNEQTHIDTLCTSLANLPPFIPINILARVASVSEDEVKSFVSDLGRPLWITDHSVQFRDEPTESWFKQKYSASTTQIEGFLKALLPLASDFPYVSECLPSLFLQAGKNDELIELALSDRFLPTNPIDQRNIRVFRLQFSFKAALKQARYSDAAKIALRAGEELAGDERQIKLLAANAELIGPLQSAQRVQELAYRRLLKGAWEGAENVYSASLLSSIPDFQGEARSYLKSAWNWLHIYFEEQKKHKEHHHKSKIDDQDLIEMASAIGHLQGPKALSRYLLMWNSSELIVRLTKAVIGRLIDAEKYENIDALAKYGAKSPYFAIALADAMMAVGKFPAAKHLRPALILLASRKTRIPKPSSVHYGVGPIESGIISFAEACAANKLPKSKILSVVKHYARERHSHSISDDHFGYEREIFLREVSLQSILNNENTFDVDSLLPNDLYSKKKGPRDEQNIKDFKQVVEGLLPWYLLRAKALVDEIDNLSNAIRDANSRSKQARSNRWKTHDRIPFEVSRIWFEILMLNHSSTKIDYDQFASNTSDKRERLLLIDRLRALRAACRLDHLAPIRKNLESSCYSEVQSIHDEGPVEISGYYIQLAKAVLCLNPSDAAAYFDHAIESVSKFGDESLERWDAVMAIASRSAQSLAATPEITYRFMRCSEAIAQNDEKHFPRDKVIAICAKLHPPSVFTAVARWNDREFGWFGRNITALADGLLGMNILSPAVLWSFSAFEDFSGIEHFAAQCLNMESRQSIRQYILDSAVQILRLKEVDEGSSRRFEFLEENARKYGLLNNGLQEVVAYYRKSAKTPFKENSLLLAHGSEKKSQVNWRKFFTGLVLTNSDGIGKAIQRFDSIEGPRSPQNFWAEILSRVEEKDSCKFLNALAVTENADTYDIQHAMRAMPKSWVKSVGVKRMWPDLLKQICKNHAVELSNHWRRKHFLEEGPQEMMIENKIHEGILEGLSQSSVYLGASSFFNFSMLIADHIAPQDALSLLDYSLTRLELHIDNEFGDGIWNPCFVPPAEPKESFAGFIIAMLASPRAGIRWQAAHCIRKLAETECGAEIDTIIAILQKKEWSAYMGRNHPFYEFHAKQYLLIALWRVVIEIPEIIKNHAHLFKELALNGLPHILIQIISSRIALALENALPGTYDSLTIQSLNQVGKSTYETLILKRGESKQNTHWHKSGAVDQTKKLHFSYDFHTYWFDPLGDVFGLPVEQVEDLAREVVFKDWELHFDGEFIDDPRRALWKYSGDIGYHQSSYPEIDDYSFYLSYHSMHVVASKLLNNMPLIHESDGWRENAWQEWLDSHTLTRDDGMWLADWRSYPPLSRRSWIGEKRRSPQWVHEVESKDFLDGLLYKQDNAQYLIVYGGWDDYDSEYVEDYYLTSAFVSPSTSQALLNALSTCKNPHDYKIPDYQEERMEFNVPDFELQGWVYHPSKEKGIDSLDPLGGNIYYPPYQIGERYIVSVLSPPFPLTSPLARILGFTQGVPCPSSPKPKPAGF